VIEDFMILLCKCIVFLPYGDGAPDIFPFLLWMHESSRHSFARLLLLNPMHILLCGIFLLISPRSIEPQFVSSTTMSLSQKRTSTSRKGASTNLQGGTKSGSNRFSTIGAPAQTSQSSRKGKRAWRKNTDIAALEEGLEELREEERITGLA
jgi:Nop53 (60S ribosomal biogenesis)